MSSQPALIKPTYDVANFGHDTSLPLNCISGNVATITPSTSTFVQVLEDRKMMWKNDEVLFIEEHNENPPSAFTLALPLFINTRAAR